MTHWLKRAGYQSLDLDSVWCRAGFEGIAYSDGDEFEERIERLLKKSEDKSLFSSQLADACADWPSYYHLSCARANILRPFEERLKGAEVLEVGAGCGAITRFLGESGASVCALEGSFRRARIARERTSELGNVTVVAENFDSFQVEHQFDVITFIGVLEYANQFVGGQMPASAMLSRAKSMLKPGGVVIIAIENQLGLKYFAGAPEDHVGRRMFGIENRYSADGVRTYGRLEFGNLLKLSGFSNLHFYAPFPDYKFPVTIFSEDGLVADDLDVSSMLTRSLFSDRQLTSFLTFDLARAWDLVVRNKLAIELTNSFLVLASVDDCSQQSGLAWHYSTRRAPQFCKSIYFERKAGGEIHNRSRLLKPDDANQGSNQLRIQLVEDQPYIPGISLAGEMISLLTTDGWRIEDVASAVKRFLKISEDLIREDGIEVSLTAAGDTVPGQYIDLIPQNIIKKEKEGFCLIDREWLYQAPVSVSWLVFRTFSAIFSALPVFASSASDFERSRLGFMVALWKALGFEVSKEAIIELGKMEANLQSLVTGSCISSDCWGPDLPLCQVPGQMGLPLYSFEEMVNRYKVMSQSLAEKNHQIHQMTEESLGQILSLENQRDHYLDTIRQIEKSVSWRITKPLRTLRSLLSGKR